MSDTACPQIRRPDAAKMKDAIQRFLDAMGLDPDAPDLQETAQRVTTAWLEDFTDGYAASPAGVLGRLMPATSGEPIFALGMRFVGICPHHLLPFSGLAHVGYLPGPHIVGLSRLSKLVDAFAHRLTLQEDLCAQIPQALMASIGARGAGCVMIAQHGCMAHRGVRQEGARIVTTHFEGAFAQAADLRAILLSQVGPHPQEAPTPAIR